MLTQGDALILTSVVSLYDQGAYALASNYGGLVARMIFQPIEESSRNLFSKLCAKLPNKKNADASSVREAAEVLSAILKAYSILSLTAWTIGPAIAPQLLDIVGGARWSATGAGAVLSAFCYYIPLLAINGVTEAFVAAVSSSSELHQQTALMTAFTAGFAIAAFVLVRVLNLGAVGLVWANCMNMLARIVWNWFFVKSYLGNYKAVRPYAQSSEHLEHADIVTDTRCSLHTTSNCQLRHRNCRLRCPETGSGRKRSHTVNTVQWKACTRRSHSRNLLDRSDDRRTGSCFDRIHAARKKL